MPKSDVNGLSFLVGYWNPKTHFFLHSRAKFNILLEGVNELIQFAVFGSLNMLNIEITQDKQDEVNFLRETTSSTRERWEFMDVVGPFCVQPTQ